MIEPTEKATRQGLLINLTGNGKGKTSSALGTAVRALGWGWNVSIIQFVKGDRETGERRFFTGLGDRVEFLSLGVGATWTPDVTVTRHVEAAQAAWARAQERLADPELDLLVLDELNIAIHNGWLDAAAVVTAMQKRPGTLHVIMTGRYADPAVIAASDLVSEINEVKHPFRQGIPSQIGIEY